MDENKFTFNQAENIKRGYNYLVGKQMKNDFVIKDILIAPYDLKHYDSFIQHYFKYQDNIKALNLFDVKYYRLACLYESFDNNVYHDHNFISILKENNIVFDKSKYSE